MFHTGFRPSRPSRRTSSDRPTYRYQLQRLPQRQIWRAPVPWQGSHGTYVAIGQELSGEYSVGVAGRNLQPMRWIPVELALTEQELIEWLRRCGVRR